MDVFSERPGDMRPGRFPDRERRWRDPFARSTPAVRKRPAPTSVSLALGAAAFYWMLPALLASGRRRRAAAPPDAEPPADG